MALLRSSKAGVGKKSFDFSLYAREIKPSFAVKTGTAGFFVVSSVATCMITPNPDLSGMNLKRSMPLGLP